MNTFEMAKHVVKDKYHDKQTEPGASTKKKKIRVEGNTSQTIYAYIRNRVRKFLFGSTDEKKFHSFCMSDDAFTFSRNNTHRAFMLSNMYTERERESRVCRVLWLEHLDLIFFSLSVSCCFHSFKSSNTLRVQMLK